MKARYSRRVRRVKFFLLKGDIIMKQTLYTLNVEKVLAECNGNTVLRYDMLKLIVAVQGLKNRDFPEIYLFWQPVDDFWLEYMTKEGKDGTLISFPSYKNKDKYYNHVWFPISAELKADIIAQIEKLV
jgi:hypothetical protein